MSDVGDSTYVGEYALDHGGINLQRFVAVVIKCLDYIKEGWIVDGQFVGNPLSNFFVVDPTKPQALASIYGVTVVEDEHYSKPGQLPLGVVRTLEHLVGISADLWIEVEYDIAMQYHRVCVLAGKNSQFILGLPLDPADNLWHNQLKFVEELIVKKGYGPKKPIKKIGFAPFKPLGGSQYPEEQGDKHEADMPLKITGFNGFVLMQKAGVPSDMIEHVKMLGVTLTFVPGELTFMSAGKKVASTKLTISQATRLMDGTLESGHKSILRSGFIAAIQACKAAVPPLPPVVKPPAQIKATAFASILQKAKASLKENKLPAGAMTHQGGNWGVGGGAAMADVTVPGADGHVVMSAGGGTWSALAIDKEPPPITIIKQDGVELFPFDQLATAPLVMLRDADKQYQPVKGTTPGKRYYCVAISQAARLGVAYSDKELSVRLEGDALSVLESASEIAQVFPHFVAQSPKGYCAMHFAIDSPLIARKALGSVMLGVGLMWLTPTPNLDLIKGL